MRNKIKLLEGDYTEGSEILFNVSYENWTKEYHKLCSHAIQRKKDYIIPQIIRAYNEGGHCYTDVCIDCIIKTINE